MRRFGRILMGAGALVGAVVGIGMLAPVHLVGVSWLLAVGLAKLTFVAGLGLMASGATLVRIANRSDAKRLEAETRAR